MTSKTGLWISALSVLLIGGAIVSFFVFGRPRPSFGEKRPTKVKPDTALVSKERPAPPPSEKSPGLEPLAGETRSAATIEAAIGRTVRDSMGKEVFTRAIDTTPLTEPTRLLLSPQKDDKSEYQTFVRSCDEEGNPFKDDTRALTSSIGTLKQTVTGVDEEQGRITVRENLEGTVTKAGSGGRIVRQELPPIFEKEFVYARNGELVSVTQQGEDVTEKFRNVPRLVFPDKPVVSGDTWECKSEAGTWNIKARVEGRAQVGKHDCVALHYEYEQELPPDQGLEKVRRKVVGYYDKQTMALVREEKLETLIGDLGKEGRSKSSFGVSERLGIDESR